MIRFSRLPVGPHGTSVSSRNGPVSPHLRSGLGGPGISGTPPFRVRAGRGRWVNVPDGGSLGERYPGQGFESHSFASNVVGGVLAGKRSGDGQSVDCQDGVEIDRGTNSLFAVSRDEQPFAREDMVVRLYYVSGLFLQSFIQKR